MTVTDGLGRPVRDGGLARWLASVIPARVRGDVGIALVSDRHIQTLNRHYRRTNAPTDVLAFEAGAGGAVVAARPFLGDIVIATGIAKRQAREAGHSYATELRVLALHGLLHLIGYDHDRPADRGSMARAETRLRRKGGLREGLISRAAGPRSRDAVPNRRSTNVTPASR